jgi:hypothetical protein
MLWSRECSVNYEPRPKVEISSSQKVWTAWTTSKSRNLELWKPNPSQLIEKVITMDWTIYWDIKRHVKVCQDFGDAHAGKDLHVLFYNFIHSVGHANSMHIDFPAILLRKWKAFCTHEIALRVTTTERRFRIDSASSSRSFALNRLSSAICMV